MRNDPYSYALREQTELFKAVQVAVLLFCLSESLFASVFCPESPIENAEDARTAFESGLVSFEEMERILSLLAYPVDLNKADREELRILPCLNHELIERIIVTQNEEGFSHKNDLLKLAGVTTEIFHKIAPFVSVSPPYGKFRLAGSGGTIFSAQENRAPEIYLRSEAGLDGLLFKDLEISGAVLFTTKEAYTARAVDSENGKSVFHVSRTVFSPSVEKFFLNATYEGVSLHIGSFTAGAGRGLVFNNSQRKLIGIYPDTSIFFNIDKGGFYRDENYQGMALSVENVSLGGSLSFDAFAFFSRIKKDVYQYYIANSEFLLKNDSTITKKLKFSTLSDFITEKTAGASLTLRFNDIFVVSLSGYALSVDFPCEDCLMDFVEWSRYPRGGLSAAAGIGAGFYFSRFSFSGEYARSITPHEYYKEGNAGIVSCEADFGAFAFTAGLRHFETGFINQYTSVYSSPDLFEGNRARDETGLHIKGKISYSSKISQEFFYDIHSHPSSKNIDSEGRTTLRIALPAKIKLNPFLSFRTKETLLEREDEKVRTDMLETGANLHKKFSRANSLSTGFLYRDYSGNDTDDLIGFHLNLRIAPANPLKAWLHAACYLDSTQRGWSADYCCFSTSVGLSLGKLFETSVSYRFSNDFGTHSSMRGHVFWWKFTITTA